MLISCDAAGLEWRVVTELSGDPTALQEILNKEDTHSKNQKFFGLPSRLIAKIYLFRTIFNRGNGYAFTVDPDFMHVSTSVKYWDDVGKKFYAKYKGIDELYDKNLATIAQGLPLVGPLGREWLIPWTTKKKLNKFTGEIEEEAALPITKAVNYPVQGTGHDIMTIARVSFNNRLKKSPYIDKTLWRSTVHDSLVLDAPSEYVVPLTVMFHQVFADIPANIKKLFGYEWKVPLECEVKAGMCLKDRWMKMPDGT
jgi:DNA polymerase I-like protein with 3'-5' exonuclease and polymerase domains